MRKSQAATEYLIIVVIALLILTPIMLKGSQEIGNLSMTKNALLARNAVDKIKDAAEIVYAQGEPARIVLSLQFPADIVEARVGDQEVMIKLKVIGNTTDIVEFFDINVTGLLPTEEGMHKIKVEAVNNSWVNISTQG